MVGKKNLDGTKVRKGTRTWRKNGEVTQRKEPQFRVLPHAGISCNRTSIIPTSLIRRPLRKRIFRSFSPSKNKTRGSKFKKTKISIDRSLCLIARGQSDRCSIKFFSSLLVSEINKTSCYAKNLSSHLRIKRWQRRIKGLREKVCIDFAPVMENIADGWRLMSSTRVA